MSKEKNFRNVQKPSSLTVKEDNREIRLIFDGNMIQSKNMQVVGNAFEGWAVAARACTLEEGKDCKIILDVVPAVHYTKANDEGHLARFLYRALRFSEQYDWFELSTSLSKEVEDFADYLKTGIFTNNVAGCDAGNTDRVEDENAIEEILATGWTLRNVLKDTVNVGNNDVYRQLPVGLFKDGVSIENSVFMRGKSAIDLWTYNDNEVSVIELKYKNRMIGIITEIYFYSNYMYDLVTQNDWFIINETPNKTPARGYEKLTVKGYDTINGIMMAEKDGYHPLVNERSIEILNGGNNHNIRYYMKEYTYKGEVY